MKYYYYFLFFFWFGCWTLERLSHLSRVPELGCAGGRILNQSDVRWPLEHSNSKLKFKYHSPWSYVLHSFNPWALKSVTGSVPSTWCLMRLTSGKLKSLWYHPTGLWSPSRDSHYLSWVSTLQLPFHPFSQSFHHLFNKHLSVSYVPGPLLGDGDSKIRKT